MKTYWGASDIGSVLIGNKDWTFAVPNIGGDGATKILVFEKDVKEFANYQKENNLHFISSVQGTFNIFSYDCAFETEQEDVLLTLSGRYGVYNGEMKVAFVKWE